MAKNAPETNPFAQKEALMIKGMWKMRSETLDYGPEPLYGKVESYTCKIIDIENRAAVFADNMLDSFSQLPSSAKDMFMYIASKLGVKKDIIELTEEDYTSRMGVSRNTFYSAKTALTNRLIIPRITRKNTYWVNPAWLCKGDRIRMYPDRVNVINEHPMKGKIDNHE